MLARLILAAALALLLSGGAQAQTPRVVPDCQGLALPSGPGGVQAVDQFGRLCTVAVLQPSQATGGLSLFRVMNAAGAAAITVKASPGRLYSYHLCNTATSTRFVRFYNTTAATTGTTPIAAGAVVIAAGSCQTYDTGVGLTFPAGISMSVTAANGDTDATAAAAGDVSGFVGYL